MAEELKDEKQFSAALAVKGSSAVLKRLLNSQAEALYPRLIGSGGLLAVIHSDAFKDWWIGDADLTISFKGQPREFSEPMQHNAYRSICCAVAALSECAPSEYVIYLRTWHLRKGASLGMIIRTMPTTKVAPTEVSRNAFTELTVRTKVHGGIVRRRHANQISVWLPVCTETD